MQQPTDDETAGLKDRERPRPNAQNTRQTLGAVGRVASRVRNSGMSKLTKANSYLQRQKEEEGACENDSPWGVGVSAASKDDKLSSSEPSKSSENTKLHLPSQSIENRSDMVELSSPLSADQTSSSPLPLEATPLNTVREEERPRRRTSDRIGNARDGSDRKSEKKNERVIGVLGAAGAARGLVKSVSRFGFRTGDRKAGGQSALNDMTKARSTTTVPLGDIKEMKHSKRQAGKGTLGVAEETKIQRAVTADIASSEKASESEPIPDTKARGFHIPGLGRARNRLDDSGNRPKATEKLKTDALRNKGKANVEKSRVKSGLARSISQAPTGSPRSEESPRNGTDSGKSVEGKRSRLKKPFKESEQKGRKGRASWFGFSGEAGDSQTKGSRGKSKDRRPRGGGEQDPEPEVGSGINGRASKDLAEMQDFAIDEYFDSDEDDMETGSAPRSMADDDFITYQTGKGRKVQGNRSRIG